jgi:hypothetical protein
MSLLGPKPKATRISAVVLAPVLSDAPEGGLFGIRFD